jgi:hypothetical protein
MSATTTDTISRTKVTKSKPESQAQPVQHKATARELAWFEACLKRGRTERFVEFVKPLSPGLAIEMLKYNLGNRRIVRSQVLITIDRLKRGDFIMLHQGAAFAKEGVLNDGQTRLTAMAESGIAGDMQITFGCERDEFRVTDQGRKRSTADNLTIMKRSYAGIRASVAKMLYSYKIKSLNSIDPEVVTEFAIEIECQILEDALRIASGMRHFCPPTSTAIAYWFIAHKTRKKDKIEPFWENLDTGEKLAGVRLRLREWLHQRDMRVQQSASQTSHRAAVIIHAWNSYIAGRRSFTKTWEHTLTLPPIEPPTVKDRK